jgi:hypothetical protein
MIRAVVLKELRESAWIAALALALYLALVYQVIPREKSVFSSIPAFSYPYFQVRPESIPFVDGTFATYFAMISYAAALGLGFRQATRESGQDTYLFLLHRPWSMTLGCWCGWATMPVAYLAAFLSGLRPGRWYATRLLPIVALLAICAVIELLQMSFGSWVLIPVVPLLDLVLVLLIIHTARTRDYS